MKSLTNKIDFAVVFTVKNANPNGDPLNSNRPRVNYDGLGELSDVCLKRKIRNRLMEDKKNIFVQSDDYRAEGDEYRSLRNRVEGELSEEVRNDEKKYRDEACKKWIDVRAFGQLFAYKAKKATKKKVSEDSEEEGKDESSVSIGIRGPVSIHSAFSVLPVEVSSIQITKSVSGEGDGIKKASDTMGMKHRVDFGVYVTYGSMNPQLAIKTGFSDEDALAIKKAIEHMFDNDVSSARPDGSMEVVVGFWWKHSNANGQYSSAAVHRSLKVIPKIDNPKEIKDYSIKIEKIKDLEPEIFGWGKELVE